MSSIVKIEDRVLFLSFVGRNYSRSSTILNANSEKFQKHFQKISPGFLRAVREIYSQRKIMRLASCVVIMSPCHILTPVVKILLRKPVILDAGWALSDGQFSRDAGPSRMIKNIKILLVDWFAFHLADLILVESKSQLIRYKRKYILPESRMRVSFTGLNEKAFAGESVKSELIDRVKRHLFSLDNKLTVLFRGKVNNESGFENIRKAAKLLEKEVSFIFLISDKDIQENFSSNVICISSVSDMEMRQIYQLADISLGQISNHPRLDHTIPHKAFEAGFFRVPYISADNGGIREFLDPGEAVFVRKPFTEGLANAIVSLSDTNAREQYAKKIGEKYQKLAGQSTLNEKFENLLDMLISSKIDIDS